MGSIMEKSSLLRNVIGEYMTELGKKDSRVVVVNADLSGTCRNKDFVTQFPERSFNVGIAEQNMVSFAAGLACEGFIPYAFSMAPFLTMRACEQCRTDVAYGNRSVRLIGVYAGVSGGVSGATHWAIEDCGIMTSIPGIAVFEVSDAIQAKKLMDYSLSYEGPMYVRVSVEATKDLYDENIRVAPGGSETVVRGDDGAFLCAGVVVQYAVEAAERVFQATGKRVRVVDLYSIKPMDEKAVLSAAETGNVIAAQDHNIFGGLGSLAASIIARAGVSTKFSILGIDDRFAVMAHAPYLYKEFGIDPDGLCNAMIRMLSQSPERNAVGE